MNNRTLKLETQNRISKYDIRPQNASLQAKNFSGRKPTKDCFSERNRAKPDLLIVGQPTRGVDIGAIEFIRKRLIDLREAKLFSQLA